MWNSIAVSKAEDCCSCRVDVATNAREIIVVLSGNCMEGKKKRQRKVTVVYLNSLLFVNLPNQNSVFCELIPKLKANWLCEWNFYFLEIFLHISFSLCPAGSKFCREKFGLMERVSVGLDHV